MYQEADCSAVCDDSLSYTFRRIGAMLFFGLFIVAISAPELMGRFLL